MGTTPTDQELMDLLDRIAAQDEPALRSLYEATSSRLYGLALRILRHKDWAEDVLQDSYLHIWRSASGYRGSLSPPLAWSDLEPAPFCSITSVKLENGTYRMNCPLPQGKTGKHVIVEKPMALNAKEASEMIDACKMANVKLLVGYRMHFDC